MAAGGLVDKECKRNQREQIDIYSLQQSKLMLSISLSPAPLQIYHEVPGLVCVACREVSRAMEAKQEQDD